MRNLKASAYLLLACFLSAPIFCQTPPTPDELKKYEKKKAAAADNSHMQEQINDLKTKNVDLTTQFVGLQTEIGKMQAHMKTVTGTADDTAQKMKLLGYASSPITWILGVAATALITVLITNSVNRSSREKH